MFHTIDNILVHFFGIEKMCNVTMTKETKGKETNYLAEDHLVVSFS